MTVKGISQSSFKGQSPLTPASGMNGPSLNDKPRRWCYFFPHFIAPMSSFIPDFIDDMECMGAPATGIIACA